MVKKSWFQYAIFGAILFILYVTGLLPQVIAFAQRGLLKTGLMNPKTEIVVDGQEINNATHFEKADLDFALRDENGRLLSLQDFEGKPIFLNFWATWCPPCIAEMPSIDEAYQNLAEEVAFVLVSTDESFQKAIDFKQKRKFKVPIYQLSGPIPAQFHSQSLPTTFVIDASGNLVLRHEGMADYSKNKFQLFLQSLTK